MLEMICDENVNKNIDTPESLKRALCCSIDDFMNCPKLSRKGVLEFACFKEDA